MKDTVILFQGDSITDGNRYKDPSQAWDLNHQIGHAYPYVIAAELGARYPLSRLVFRNRGVSGDSVAKLFARWRQDTLALKPDVLSVLVGINDQGEYGSGPERFERVYRMLLDEAREDNPSVRFVVMEPFALPVGHYAEEWAVKREKLSAYRSACRRVAADYGAIFVPLQEKFEALCRLREASYWIWDGVHPTEAGHGIIAREWMDKARDILPLGE